MMYAFAAHTIVSACCRQCVSLSVISSKLRGHSVCDYITMPAKKRQRHHSFENQSRLAFDKSASVFQKRNKKRKRTKIKCSIYKLSQQSLKEKCAAVNTPAVEWQHIDFLSVLSTT